MVIIQLDTEQLKSLIQTEFRKVLNDQPPAEYRPGPNEERPLNVGQTAEFLGISEQTVYQNIKKIPHKKRFGRLYFIKSELVAYLEAGTQKTA
ncbi:helix-turn-helix domain-containing protein [Fibrella sp. HMF5335]|uniref:Helix-turn-helix domain-containing protein n=1 Tax=Fibrella rubiginis TaxID=2817060 RepID=A0A939GIL1_9BACT|nr:helix-turn-helix domain-containing protein [Fibrella rubiginis]MBO0937904.1 helix-turn-helix domain-containing protein [Fibrella rubiginis]